MERVLDFGLNRNLEFEIVPENQNIIKEVSDAFGNAINQGVDGIDMANEYRDLVKAEVKNGEIKTAGMQAVEAALRIGAKAIGVNQSTFNSVKDIIEALKRGDLKKGLSAAIDIGVDMIKGIPVDAKKLIKSSKNLFLGESFDSELKRVMVKQKNTIDRLDKKCNKFDKALTENNEKEMEKQIKSIKTDLEKVMIIENTINRARSIINKYELIRNKGTNILTHTEEEICEKIG